MPIKDPQRDLPAGLRGGSDTWDQRQAAVVLADDYFAAAAPPPPPPSGATLVQTTSVGSADFANASVTFASPVTAGNTLIIYGAVEEFGTPAPALSSNQGDTFVTTIRNANNNAAVLARVDSAVGGSTTITLTGGSYHRLVAQEWSGLTYDSGAGTATAIATDTITVSTPNSTTSANSVVFSSWAVRTGGSLYGAQTVPTGYTESGRFVSTTRGQFVGAHRAETTTGVKSAQWVDPGIFPDDRAAVIFAFTAASGGPTIVSTTQAGAWSVRNFSTASQSGAWSVRALVSASQAGAWTVRALASATQAGAWTVRAFSTATQAGAWTVRNFAVGSISGAWSVASSVVIVTSSVSGAWTVRNFITGAQAGAWTVRNSAAGTQAGAWSVRNFASATRAGAWSVRNFASATRGGSWTIRNFAFGTVSGSWSVGDPPPLPDGLNILLIRRRRRM